MEKVMVEIEGVAEEVTRLTCRLFDNACELVREVPSYILRTNLTGRFWEEMEEFVGPVVKHEKNQGKSLISYIVIPGAMYSTGGN